MFLVSSHSTSASVKFLNSEKMEALIVARANLPMSVVRQRPMSKGCSRQLTSDGNSML